MNKKTKNITNQANKYSQLNTDKMLDNWLVYNPAL